VGFPRDEKKTKEEKEKKKIIIILFFNFFFSFSSLTSLGNLLFGGAVGISFPLHLSADK